MRSQLDGQLEPRSHGRPLASSTHQQPFSRRKPCGQGQPKRRQARHQVLPLVLPYERRPSLVFNVLEQCLELEGNSHGADCVTAQTQCTRHRKRLAATIIYIGAASGSQGLPKIAALFHKPKV
ncbi:unnamed protein product [Lampetra fluviatilis]